jgi:hypothetical protein
VECSSSSSTSAGTGGTKLFVSTNPSSLDTPHHRATTPSRRLHDLEHELSRVREELRESQQHHDSAEQELYAAKAEREVLRLQVGSDNTIDASFVQRAVEYETEIGQLKIALQKAEQKSRARLAWDDHDEDAIQRLNQNVEEDRRKLARLRSELGETDTNPPLDTPSRMDREEKAEEAQIKELTEKYIEEDDESHISACASPAQANDENDLPVNEATVDTRVIRSDLIELSRNIAAKEDLIGQLRLSQEKYAVSVMSVLDFLKMKRCLNVNDRRTCC